MADPLVEEWHCRDLDSRITSRELAAVEDWRTTGKTYHIMRDNRCYDNKFSKPVRPKAERCLSIYLKREHIFTTSGFLLHLASLSLLNLPTTDLKIFFKGTM